MRRVAISGLFGGVLLWSWAAGAASEPRPCEPEAVVRAVYRLVQRTPQPSSLDVIRPFSNPSLKALIAREKACVKTRNEICAIDFDILTSSQDYDRITLVSASTSKDGALEQVHAVVDTGMAKPELDFTFARKGACAEIVDIRSEVSDDRWSLRKLLSDFHRKP